MPRLACCSMRTGKIEREINSDFRVFADMVTKFVNDYGGSAALKDTVEDAVRAWFEQALVETVIGIQAMKNAKEGALQDIENALSEEALTAAVMPRYHVPNSVKRELGLSSARLKLPKVVADRKDARWRWETPSTEIFVDMGRCLMEGHYNSRSSC